MERTYYVLDKSTLLAYLCNEEQASVLAKLDKGEISWAVERTGRCDTDKHIIIHTTEHNNELLGE